ADEAHPPAAQFASEAAEDQDHVPVEECRGDLLLLVRLHLLDRLLVHRGVGLEGLCADDDLGLDIRQLRGRSIVHRDAHRTWRRRDPAKDVAARPTASHGGDPGPVVAHAELPHVRHEPPIGSPVRQRIVSSPDIYLVSTIKRGNGDKATHHPGPRWSRRTSRGRPRSSWWAAGAWGRVSPSTWRGAILTSSCSRRATSPAAPRAIAAPWCDNTTKHVSASDSPGRASRSFAVSRKRPGSPAISGRRASCPSRGSGTCLRSRPCSSCSGLRGCGPNGSRLPSGARWKRSAW